ncbi:hypothetical protein TcYC6_0068650 [Trypanosoma cruzi]|uniref:Uncharacterized protein n=1 Tax=Trypanosoma cruzi TaxID=5693 RepID=A0A2V2W169_TRYCR|nr:hypothetical protein TcBrA4_0062830 [Trypanosoma cruzi]KAF8299066.1 hypothetical protein TcYC6_0068650 [Trypanosoma cruzi]PBJ73156.1 hypothetical protein BCY84_13974 [Trypanosoma cruzi cruzi]PWV02382.1 hypothetical protein C4B63_2g106 [Trypanosoma cruzi]RNF24711.1 hypothetical protein TcG_00497 [Trypanosoma cruzi]
MTDCNGKEPPPSLDERTLQNMRIAKKIGAETFEENTAILRRMAWRGARAFIVCGVGMAAFGYAMRRRRQQQLQQEGLRERERLEDDPTARYLEEMRGLGFDVDTLEEELEAERRTVKAR